jgi:hypothetical protein
VATADLAGVHLHHEGHAFLEDPVGVRLWIARVGHARTLLLEADPVDHALVPLRHVLCGKSGRSFGQLPACNAGVYEVLHGLEPVV